MFSRVAKSIVQSINQRGYHVTKTNFKAITGSKNTGKQIMSPLLQDGAQDTSTIENMIPFKNLKFNNSASTSPNGKEVKSGMNTEKLPVTSNINALDLAQVKGPWQVLDNGTKFAPVQRVPILMSNTYGDHTRNDDYFPQGEEYEDEIGSEGYLRPIYPQQQQPQNRTRNTENTEFSPLNP